MVRLAASMAAMGVLVACGTPPATDAWHGNAPEDWVHFVGLEYLASKGTFEAPHAVTSGVVTKIEGQNDGDIHITLTSGESFVILEPIPQLALDRLPRLQEPIEAWGIVRWDLQHDWGELHPLLGWRPHGQWNGPKFYCNPANCIEPQGE